MCANNTYDDDLTLNLPIKLFAVTMIQHTNSIADVIL